MLQYKAKGFVIGMIDDVKTIRPTIEIASDKLITLQQIVKTNLSNNTLSQNSLIDISATTGSITFDKSLGALMVVNKFVIIDEVVTFESTLEMGVGELSSEDHITLIGLCMESKYSGYERLE